MIEETLDAHGIRFFARVLAADVECPRCGTIISFGQGRKQTRCYDRPTATLECPRCGRKYVVGLLLWPRSTLSGVANSTPKDQVPNERQIAALRINYGARLLDEPKPNKRPRATNVVVGTCTCTRSVVPSFRRKDPDCEIHGFRKGEIARPTQREVWEAEKENG